MTPVPSPRFTVCILSLATVLLSGCALEGTAPPAPLLIPAFSGTVHGGNPPVIGATIQLYAVGTGGYASAATPLLTGTPVTTDSTGSFTFNITGDTCPSADTQVYLTATDGNPGLASGTDNTALALMAALGNCGSLTDSSNVNLNEVTTIGAVFALSQFMSGYANVGTKSTNLTGIANAFVNANAVVDFSSGMATLNYTSATNPDYPQYAINTLANSLAACVNSDGSTAAGTACAKLFAAVTPSGGAAPSDTVQAALDIALHPGSNVAGIYNIATATAPFQPSFPAAPNDWTIYITYPLFDGYLDDTAMDASGNFWLLSTDSEAGAEAIGPAGTFYCGLGGPETVSMAFDGSGNLWSVGYTTINYTQLVPKILVVDPATNTQVAGYTGSALPTTETFHVAFDSLGNFWMTEGASTYIVSSAGAALANTASPVGGVADANGEMWSAQGSTLTKAALSGSTINTSTFTGGNLSSPLGQAIDHTGNIWVLNSNSTISEFDNTGSAITTGAGFSGGGLNTTGARTHEPIAIDGSGDVWAASYAGNVISEFDNTGKPISPATGYGAYVAADNQRFGLVQESVLPAYQPSSIGIDLSGDVWVIGESSTESGTDPYNLTVAIFLGAATPVTEPLAVAAASNTIGMLP